MATCTKAGPWDNVLGSGHYSREQWRAVFLIVLCQMAGGTPDMATCTLAGLWNNVQGTGTYPSEQEFMAESINLLCQIANAGGTTGGGQPTSLALNGANPPVDGSVSSYWVYDSVKGYLWTNIGTIAAPNWKNV